MGLPMYNYGYNYIDGGYLWLGVHRKILEYNPQNTQNIIIQDYLNNPKINKKRESTLTTMLLNDIECKHSSSMYNSLPSPYEQLLYDINISWIELIKEMIFKDNFIQMFYSEFNDIIEKVIKTDTFIKKEIVVYRYYGTGETMFHYAAKSRLIDVLEGNRDHIKIREIISKELTHILNCYQELGRCFDDRNSSNILNIKDYSNKTLKEHLVDFSLELTEKDF